MKEYLPSEVYLMKEMVSISLVVLICIPSEQITRNQHCIYIALTLIRCCTVSLARQHLSLSSIKLFWCKDAWGLGFGQQSLNEVSFGTSLRLY